MSSLDEQADLIKESMRQQQIGMLMAQDLDSGGSYPPYIDLLFLPLDIDSLYLVTPDDVMVIIMMKFPLLSNIPRANMKTFCIMYDRHPYIFLKIPVSRMKIFRLEHDDDITEINHHNVVVQSIRGRQLDTLFLPWVQETRYDSDTETSLSHFTSDENDDETDVLSRLGYSRNASQMTPSTRRNSHGSLSTHGSRGGKSRKRATRRI